VSDLSTTSAATGTSILLPESGDRPAGRRNPELSWPRAHHPDGQCAQDGFRRSPGRLQQGPLESVVALQHLARCLAVVLGRDADKPRNLAKSVTVL
jgi:hypothetical protein